MKHFRIGILLIAIAFAPLCTYAQHEQNKSADNIVGTYECEQNGMRFKAKIEKIGADVYQGQIVWLEQCCDEEGQPLLDKKNPNRLLRTTPLNQVILFKGLRYDAKQEEWGGCKAYDPSRGLWKKLVAHFDEEGKLNLTTTLLDVSEEAQWLKIE